MELRDAPLELAHRILQGELPPDTAADEGYGGKLEADPSPLATVAQGIAGVFGLDQRVRVVETSDYPKRANGRWTGNGCTGTFIGSRTVLLAAHCVFDRATHQWKNLGSFVPGRSSGSSNDTPWGTWSIQTFYIPTAWTLQNADDDWEYDYGVADLNIAPGYYGSPGWYGTSNSYGSAIYTYGYPSQAVGGAYISPNLQQWWSYSGTVSGSSSYEIESTSLDVTHGNSGGCVYSGNYVCNAVVSSGNSSANYFHRYNSAFSNFVVNYSAYF